MKYIKTFIKIASIIGIVLIITIGIYNNYLNIKEYDSNIYNHNNKDTTMLAYVSLEHKLTLTKDTLISVIEEYEKLVKVLDIYQNDNITIHNINDSLKSELFIYKYKLERIRYYNDIAKNGNNIKYLRGWINRTLNE